MIDLQEWAGTDEELLDTIDEAIGQFEIALAEDGFMFSDERDARRLFMEAFSRHDIQERILITAQELLEQDRAATMGDT